MRYRISKAQVQMLLDGKALNMGNGRSVVLPNYSDAHKKVAEIVSDPERFEHTVFYTDGISIITEGKV